jgi:hypothetical protein
MNLPQLTSARNVIILVKNVMNLIKILVFNVIPKIIDLSCQHRTNPALVKKDVNNFLFKNFRILKIFLRFR